MSKKTLIVTGLVAAFFCLWTMSIQALDTRERNANPNQELDTFVFHKSSTPALWEIALPSNSYYVTLTVGDPSYFQGPHIIKFSGDNGSSWNTVVDSEYTVANEFVGVINEPVTVTDQGGGQGSLQLEVGGNPDHSTMVNFIIISDSIETPPTFPIEVNFLPNGSTNYPGYQEDHGEIYSEANGSGWDIALDSRDRGEVSGDRRLDTFVFNRDLATWELDVPIGTYYVTLSVGDPSYQQGPMNAAIEGVTVIDNKETLPNTFANITNHIVNVFDGKLSIGIGLDGASRSTMLNYITVTDTRPDPVYPERINFQPGAAELVLNFRPDAGAIYKDIYGYGWSAPLNCRERNMNDNQLYDTIIYEPGTSATTWDFTLASATPATYYVYLGVGDAQYECFSNRVILEGTTAVDGVYTAANEFYEISNYAVPVSDGVLTMQIGGGSNDTHINYIIIDDTQWPGWSDPIKINYQPGGSTVPSGYEKDGGDEFDIVRRYGWSATTSVRERSGPYDQKYLTIVNTPASTIETWKIEDISNGTYYVTLAFGDAEYQTGPFHVVLEPGEANEVTVLNESTGTTHPPGNFIDITDQQVTVSDGKLELQMGHADGNNHICFIEISTTPQYP